MSIEMKVSDARADFSTVTGRAEFAGETVYLTKNGRRAVAVVSAHAAELLEQIEDLVDVREATAAIDALAAGTEQRRRYTRHTPRTT